jgi:outer membrane protein TolC
MVRGAVHEVEAAVGRVQAARAERRPWASINSFAAGGSAANIVQSPAAVQPQMIMGLPGGAFFDQNVSVMYPLFTGGRLRAMVQQAQALQSASRAQLETTRQDVALMVRMAYREVLARRSFVGVHRAALEQNRERLRIDQVAFEQQRIPRFYLLRDEAEVANGEQMLANAERDVEISLIQLKTLMGVHLESRLELTEPLQFQPSSILLSSLGVGDAPAPTPGATEPAGGGDPQLRRLLEIAERNRPELAAAARRREAGQAEVGVAQSAYRPQLGVGVMADLMKMKGEPLFGGATFGLSASLPILDGGLRRARLSTARAEAQRMEEERQQAALQVGQETATALANLRAAERNVLTARSAVTAAAEDYRIALLRYTSGVGINVEALDALTARVRAQNNEVQALFEHNIARDRLARALGTLSGSATP